jgi:hypothetical protein
MEYKICYNLEHAQKYNINSRNKFIISRECLQKYIENGIEKYKEREFIVFKNVNSYLKHMNYFNHCHEVICKRDENNIIPLTGRLAFDFDIHVVIPLTFKEDIEYLISSVVKKYYINIDPTKFKYIWMSSENKTKISKHLVVKNCFFYTDWVSQIKTFYKLMMKEISTDEKFKWITDVKNVIDIAWPKSVTYLRLPLNSKLEGNILKFDDENTEYSDGLVCIYDCETYLEEQKIKYCNQKEYEFLKDIKKKVSKDMSGTKSDKIYDIFDKYNNGKNGYGLYTLGSIKGNMINLIRVEPGKCLISHKHHDKENAYLVVGEDGGVRFFCRRQCKNILGHNYVKICEATQYTKLDFYKHYYNDIKHLLK